MNFNLIPDIFTDRLVLRKLDIDDSELVFTLRSNKEVTKYISRPLYKDVEEARKFIADRINDMDSSVSIIWSISLKDSLTSIGTICLWNFSKDKKTAEVGYDMLPEFQGKGYLSEALKRIVVLGLKELKLDTIEAYTSKHNEASIKLLEKNHFNLQKEKIDKECPENLIYSLKLPISYT